MSLILVTPPTARPVSLPEVKAHLRVDANDEDVRILEYIGSAVSELDGADGWLGRALITQTWDLKLDEFGDEIVVPLPPLQTVDEITYIDGEGASQTLNSSLYRVVGVGQSSPATIVPASGASWPTPRSQQEAVTVRFTAGYGNTAGAVPAAIRHAITEMVADMFEYRVTLFPGSIEITGMAEKRLLPFRVNWL